MITSHSTIQFKQLVNMVETRLDVSGKKDPLLQKVQTKQQESMDVASRRGNIQKRSEHFDIKVDISDSNANYYDGMDQMSGLKKKLRH